jgi:vitamin B12/bleomycin/antimicrobial peptide transport system ATP-binding/permease protein
MLESPKHPMFGRRFVRHLWRLTRTYWSSTDARKGAPLLAGAIVLELGAVYGNLRLSDAERGFMDALQNKQAAAFLTSMGIFAAISAAVVLIAAYRIYLRQLVEIRWRRGVTTDYVDRWMSKCAYGLAQLHRGQVDNPDQRIAEDVREFAASALGLSLSLLGAVSTLVTFGGLLWAVSAHWVLPLGTWPLHIPGFLFWIGLLYAALSTWLTHVVGRPLVRLNVDRLRYEADFRSQLMRFRDNVEGIVLSRGDPLERRATFDRFGNVVGNWWQLIAAQRRLTIFTGVIGQANGVVPLLVAAPGFFAGLITLGIIVQIRFAYGQVSGALNWFVYAYQEIARWRANVERLSTFREAIDTTVQDLERSKIQIVPGKSGTLRLTNLELDTSTGQALIETVNAAVTAGERVAIVGPSGAGKTTLFRAIAGIWPFGKGCIELPPEDRMLFVPQWPYLPRGSLRVAVSYPAGERAFSDERIRDVLRLLGLERLAARLDDTEPWDQLLSPHEQQRLAIARVFLNEPDWVFLDKATSALDEETEERVQELLAARLPHTTVISVADRSTGGTYYGRRWTLTPKNHGPSSLRAA